MKSFRMTTAGQPPALCSQPVATPAAGEVSINIAACGLNFADLLMISGQYQDTPALPFTLGMEIAGTVLSQGARVAMPAPGTRVAVFSGQGGLAQQGCFPAARCVPLPDGMNFEEAAAFQIAYGTSHLALGYKARLQPGETLLVLGAAGGVGLAAVEIGKLMGARVIACARGAAKLEIAKRAGAVHLIDSSNADIRAGVKALGGADVIYDPVGGDQFKAAFRACNPDGRILLIGFASGEVPPVAANHMLVKNITLIGINWAGYLKFRPDALTGSLRQVFAWYEQGRLHPHISHILPLDQAAEALELLRQRQSSGKIVVSCAQEA
jgi:NADPH:quinone reductase